jgi:hypothetical protein
MSALLENFLCISSVLKMMHQKRKVLRSIGKLSRDTPICDVHVFSKCRNFLSSSSSNANKIKKSQDGENNCARRSPSQEIGFHDSDL